MRRNDGEFFFKYNILNQERIIPFCLNIFFYEYRNDFFKNTNLVLSASASTGQQREGAGALGAMLYACRTSLSP